MVFPFSMAFSMVFPWFSHESALHSIANSRRFLGDEALRADGQHPILKAQLMPPARRHHQHLASTTLRSMGYGILLVFIHIYIYISIVFNVIYYSVIYLLEYTIVLIHSIYHDIWYIYIWYMIYGADMGVNYIKHQYIYIYTYMYVYMCSFINNQRRNIDGHVNGI